MTPFTGKVLVVLVILCNVTIAVHGFVPSGGIHQCNAICPGRNAKVRGVVVSGLETNREPLQKGSALYASSNPDSDKGATKRRKVTTTKKEFTLADLARDLIQNPARLQPQTEVKKKKYRRTRKRVENPQQKYLYKSQREYLERIGELPQKTSDEADQESSSRSTPTNVERDPCAQAKAMGLIIPAQHCNPLIDDREPSIVGSIRVGEDTESGSYAYLIDKPPGWSILGSSTPKQRLEPPTNKSEKSSTSSSERPDKGGKDRKHVNPVDKDGILGLSEYNESDILSLLTPEERVEYLRSGSGLEKQISSLKMSKITAARDESTDVLEPVYNSIDKRPIDSSTLENIRRIFARRQINNSTYASFASKQRPSVITWLKETKASEGKLIRGGSYWTAVSGATEVDDSGLVLVCPKDKVANIFVEYSKYTAIAGTGGYLAPKSKVEKSKVPQESIDVEILSTLKKGRDDDVVFGMKVVIPDTFSTCASIVDICQTKVEQGIRGDPAANPFDRRSWRRLIHCSSLSASSLICDENMQSDTAALPSDVSLMCDRRSTFKYEKGSFFGRSSLRDNPLTTAYREINGLADGIPGWIVDRYDKWLFIQHDPNTPKGPLPSIHDGNTAGVYYIQTSRDRSTIGMHEDIRPRLLEGQRAPDLLTVLENGVKYVVSLDKDMSTGLFLDQRLSRAWLLQNCSPETQVLNCFAHTGAFSVAAAVAGASTVNLESSKKYLTRFPQSLEANGIPFDERHDCIYGDCFEWLTRLSKRGEKYDIVILDPPNSILGTRTKRWSIKNDMAELVALAAPLVKSGGLLWTSTASAGIHPMKFAKMCQKGLGDAGIGTAKLENIQPMPFDFPTIGSQPVKNLTWRMP